MAFRFRLRPDETLGLGWFEWGSSRYVGRPILSVIRVMGEERAQAETAEAREHGARDSGAGSTWAYPAIHSWITSAAQGGITVNYTPNGSASGRSFFKAGLADWAQSEI